MSLLSPLMRVYFMFVLIVFMTSCRNNKNSITVRTSQDLKAEKVEIRKGFVSINRKDDRELFKADFEVVFEGEYKKNLRTDFGENDFLVLYNNEFYYLFRHFIESDFYSEFPKGHDYDFYFFLRQDSLFF